jgi:hypothetical protein
MTLRAFSTAGNSTTARAAIVKARDHAVRGAQRQAPLGESERRLWAFESDWVGPQQDVTYAICIGPQAL